MFRDLVKLTVVSAVVLGSSVALAGHHRLISDDKGERDYKSEVPAPCPTYVYATGPYLGLSVGDRTNYTGQPTVYKGIEGTASLGYGFMFNPMLYVAGEFFGGSSIKVKDFTNLGGVRSKWSYGLDVIPGVMLTDYVLAYVRAGVIRTRFSDQGVNRTGWHVGVGTQTNVWQNIDVRAEYVYSLYGRVNGIGKPNSDLFNVGVVYKFI